MVSGFVVLVVSSITFPPGIGRYLAGHLAPKGHVDNLFANFTWMTGNLSDSQEVILNNWRTNRTGPYLHLLSFMGFMFLMSIFASTMPVPNGTFIPTFRFGAAFGRIIGEIMATWYPDGFFYGGRNVHVIPGGYATVGAAAFTGAVTQTVSVAVIVFEMTGQICHAIPILIAVLIAVGISTKLGPSCYNNVIIIKKLPYLPDLLPSVSKMYTVTVDDFMVTNVKFIHLEMTYVELENVLKENPKLKTFPIVENSENMILLGSAKRNELIKLLEEQIGRKKRLEHIFKKVFQDSKENLAPEEDKSSETTVETNNRLSTYDNQTLRHSVSTPGIFGGESYVTVEGTLTEDDDRFEKRKEKAFRSIFRKVPKNQGSFKSLLGGSKGSSLLASKGRTVMLRHPIRDMNKTERKKWEEVQMACLVDFSSCCVDPAPFQLVQRTSLLKVHSLFSLMGLNQAYVTAIGSLVGVVGLKELRKAIEEANNGILRPSEILTHDSYLRMKDSTFLSYV